MNDSQISRECMNLVFAGSGSTAAALTVVLHALGSEQARKWQERSRTELASYATREHGGGEQHLQGMSPVLTAVIKETLRLRPPFPRGFPRDVAPGAKVLIPGVGELLSSGTMVSSSSYVIGRSQEVWGVDTAQWRPERWLKEEYEAARGEITDNQRDVDDGFVVFGKGARGCIGKELAMMIIFEVVAKVLQRWDVRAKGELEEEDSFEMRYNMCQVELAGRT